jgi:hypothetical protein
MIRDAEQDEMGYGEDNYRAPDEETWDHGDSRAYWRRRFFILCGGVAALGICAWLFPGTHHTQARPSAAVSASMAALAGRQSLPPAATGSAWAPPSPTPSPSPSARPSSSPSPSASPAASAKLAAAAKKAKQKVGLAYHAHPSASGSAAAGAACAPADIVLSLFAGKSSYSPGDPPSFSVYAVSTSGSACTLAYGAGSVQVVVTRHGQVVWDSAACKPAAAKPLRFTLGVPRELTLTWNRKAAGPAGCAGSLPAGATGTFDAVAMRGGQSSPVATFKIS